MSQPSQPPSPGFAGSDRFAVRHLLGTGGMGVVYAVFDHERGEHVALKSLRRVDPDTLYLFKQEFRSLTTLAHPNLLSVYELFVVDGRWHFTMELLNDAVDFRHWVRRDAGDTDATSAGDAPTVMSTAASLKDAATPAATVRPVSSPQDIPRLRAALVQLVNGVIALHRAELLHRDLKPENVLVTPDGRVRLLDFGLIADLKRAQTPGANVAAGGLSSPGSDSGPEAYIAGTVAYMSPEQAAAATLTPASDWYAVGVMLYEVLTGRLPFTGSVKDVFALKQETDPPPPSTLVAGIPADLDALCMALLQRAPEQRPSGVDVLSQLGVAPSPEAAEIATETDSPFVGRQGQLDQLQRAFDRARTGRVVVCRVHGRSGAGKSVLVSHFQDQLQSRGSAVVLSGRCYEQEAVPYKAWDNLMDSLYHHLARKAPRELRALLPPDIGALARVFPVLKRLPGVRDAAVAGGELREQRRLAVHALAQLFGRMTVDRPLVLVIDDLQWGDVDSAELLVALLQSTAISRMLVLVAHRTETPGRVACLDALTAAERTAPPDAAWEVAEVAALSEGETLQLALSLLGSGRADARPLAERILHESGGNPYLIVELARHVRAGLDIAGLAGLDLDAMLWDRIERLADAPRRLLETIAIAGHPIRVRDAARAGALDGPSQQIVGVLRQHRFVRTAGPGFDDEIECYHDRIRESIAGHLAPEAQQTHHARLAEVLEASGVAPPETIAIHLRHVNPGRAATLYGQAGAAAAEVLAFDRAEAYYRDAVTLADTPTARAGHQIALIHFYADTTRFAEAYATGRQAAAAFGVALPAGFSPPAFVADLITARIRLGRRRVADLVHLPDMQDERHTWAVRIISATAKSAFQVRPELCVAISAKAVNLCLRHGNLGESAVPYMVFGAIFLGGVLGRYDSGYEFGRLALDLVDRYDNRKQRAEVLFVVGYFGTSWLKPAKEAEALWARAYEAGLETGDLFHTGCASAGTVQSLLMRGAPLADVLTETERHADWLERAQQREPLGCVRAVQQAVRLLRGEPGSLDESRFVQELASYSSKHFAHFHFVNTMLTHYLLGRYAEAARVATAATGYVKASAGMLHSAEHLFLDALIGVAPGTTPSAKHVRALKRAQRKFAAWSARCPENFASKARLLAGEAARVAGTRPAAAAHYAAAIEAAQLAGHVQITGMANARWADLHTAAGEHDEARRRREAAVEAWTTWGATAVAERMTDASMA